MSLTTKEFFEGIRLRTLPAAIAPVVTGCFAANHIEEQTDWLRAILALLVGVFMQIGVNLSNDYSDGIRGTDRFRKGPLRLTASGRLTPRQVLRLAVGSYAVASLAGLILVAVSQTWWLLLLGVLCVAAGWFYTGGSRPYAYIGYGISEVSVFVFFGLFATVGTCYTQSYSTPLWLWVTACGYGFINVAVLTVNNLRDIETDAYVDKHTLMVQIGVFNTRVLYVALVLTGICCFLCGSLLFYLVEVPGKNWIYSATTIGCTFAVIATLCLLWFIYSSLRDIIRRQGLWDLLLLLKKTSLLNLLACLLLTWPWVLLRWFLEWVW